ncbi:MAG TPA: hypothetical protein VHV30_14465 [Polyangiaceae bacterium]|jgi:hypothetical protein|nr:hypothetical protein [Polyangiaceae bacterium]
MPRVRRRPRARALASLAILAVLVVVCAGACASTRDGGALEPRFVAVHNALTAMGLAQVGPIQQGSLAEGQTTRVSLELPAGCVTVAAIGGAGVRDVDATLIDPRGTPLAHDTTAEPQAVLRPCLEAADTYVLAVKVAAGAGPWIAAAWAGGLPAPAASAAPAPEANGTCDAPIPLAAGTVSGSTTHGEHENAGSCGPSDSRELVYELDVTRRQRITLEVEARFDSVLYLRKDDCTDANAEVDCNDDGPDRTHSRVERVVDPGKYYVFVDGYGQESGSFKLTATTSDVLALTDLCQKAPALGVGMVQTATTAGLADNAQATCGGGAEGSDAAWRADIASRARVRIVEHSDEVAPVVHVRRACADEQSEIACGEGGGGAGDAAVTGIFEPGMYTVFADARERDSTGHYSLLFETAPPAGSGAPGDGCGDAAPLLLGSGASAGTATGDTFAARDDVAGTCGGAGAPDLVYRLEVPRRSRFVASLDGEEAPHVLVLWKRCAERGSEVACGRSIDQVLPPGTYYVGVDGAASDEFGRFTLAYALRDLTGQAAACAAAPVLTEGHPMSGTTAGATDKFATSCGGTDTTPANGPDKVFRLVVPARAPVRITVTAPGFDAAVALRNACTDGSPGQVELTCEGEADNGRRTSIERTLDPGTYWVVVDGTSPNDQGPFTVEYRTTR